MLAIVTVAALLYVWRRLRDHLHHVIDIWIERREVHCIERANSNNNNSSSNINGGKSGNVCLVKLI